MADVRAHRSAGPFRLACARTQDDLTLRGDGGRAHLRADGHDAQGKAIWVIAGDRTTVDRIELSGAAVPDRNGAGDGFSHNLYVGAVRSLTVTGSRLSNADTGHELKSRAAPSSTVRHLRRAGRGQPGTSAQQPARRPR